MEYLSRAIKAGRALRRVALRTMSRASSSCSSWAASSPRRATPKERAELAAHRGRDDGQYGKGKYCPERLANDRGKKCLSPRRPREHPRQEPQVRRAARRVARLARHRPADQPKFARYVELGNEGAREIGFRDLGELWRSGYDMSPAAFEAETDRLWSEVKPLYDKLHCYVRARLRKDTGPTRSGRRPRFPRTCSATCGRRSGERLRPRRALQGRGLARRDAEDQGEEARREGDGQARRELLHLARARSAARDVLGALALHEARGPRGRLPRERVGRDVLRRSPHQDVRRAEGGRPHHDPPRARSRLLLPLVLQAPDPLPAGRERRLPRGDRRHDRAQRDAGVPEGASASSTRSRRARRATSTC